MRGKIGRNDPCWCGSGKKYKNCHLNRDKQEPLNLWQAEKELQKAFSFSDCLAPTPMKKQCSDTIAKAHTVPKSNSLQKIARNNHVYSFVPSIKEINKGKGKLFPKLLGINKASTFTGFCSFHDNAIFSKIEKQHFTASQEQCFLLAYRSISRELYNKRAQVSLLDTMQQTDRGKPLVQQYMIQQMADLYSEGAYAGLSEIEHHKKTYDNALLIEDFENVRAYIIELDCPPPIMCCTSIFPEVDFNGKRVQEMRDKDLIPYLLNFTSFHGGNYGVIAFTWLSDSEPACRPFIDSLRLLPPGRITDSLIRFFFEFSENLHIQPDWWENLPDDKKDTLITRFVTSLDITAVRNPECLADDGTRFDNWPISRLRTVGF